MKKIFLSLLYLCALQAVENHIFTGIGFILPTTLKTSFSQVVTKEINSCPDSVCIGGKSSANYQGKTAKNSVGIRFILGNETSFDHLKISGMRFYGTMEISQASLGKRNSEIITEEARDKQYQTITSNDNNTPVIKNVKMLSPRTQQDFLFSNALMTTFSLNLDFFANLPISYFIKKYIKEDFPFLFDLGVFAGFGAEISLLKSPYWINETLYSNQTKPFYASGNGLFINLGGHLYLTKKDRIEFSVKLPFYQLSHEEWNSYTEPGTNIWQEQTLRQTFHINKKPEFKISYIMYF